MMDNLEPVEAMSANEIERNLWKCMADLLSRKGSLMDKELCELMRENSARLREREAARKVAHDYQTQEVKATLTNTYFVGVHLEEALDAARERKD
jgi:hypothetical protein